MSKTAIVQPLGLTPSFGFGDRIGLATPGHVAALRRSGNGIAPIFPQQSIREMTRTGRTAEEVMSDALNGASASGWTGITGADADHLKTPEDVDITAAAGFTFFTIDPSDYVDEKSDGYDEKILREKYEKVRDQIDWIDTYKGKQIPLTTGTEINLDEESVMRTAVKYGIALIKGIELADYIRVVNEGLNRDFEIELSVDETEQPTSLAEHYIVADQCLKHDMKLVSLAPRFPGDLEKGVDYIGDVQVLEKNLCDHSAIAKMLGPYKLSLHSGSDKLSMYTIFARTTAGRFHVKTAGTSYLEALRVAAHYDPELFRRICEFSRERYNTDKATYHVHATLDAIPSPAEISDGSQLEAIYLEKWEDVPHGNGFTKSGRQILHCTFGSVLNHDELGTALRNTLTQNADAYREILEEHFARHLDALLAGL